jgi:hypothetical protein
VEANKQLLQEHREQLKRMIEACKALHEGFEDQRKEVKAEKMKKIRHAISDGIFEWRPVYMTEYLSEYVRDYGT